jgi:hypothetical protein
MSLLFLRLRLRLRLRHRHCHCHRPRHPRWFPNDRRSKGTSPSRTSAMPPSMSGTRGRPKMQSSTNRTLAGGVSARATASFPLGPSICGAGRAVVAWLALVLAGCTGDPATTDAPAAGTRYEGFASYHPYDDVPGINVACSPAASTEFDPKNFGLMVTALQDLLFDQLGKAEVCHKCAVVTSLPQQGGNGHTVTVRIIDRTQDHLSNGGRRYLDLAPQAFSMIGEIAKGFIPVSFQIADCPAELR